MPIPFSTTFGTLPGKANEKSGNAGEEPTSDSVLEHDLRHNPPVVQNLVKGIYADRYIVELICQWHTKDEIEKLVVNWDYETQPSMGISDIMQKVDSHWQRYGGLYPEINRESTLFQSRIVDWSTVAWEKLLNYLEDWKPYKGELIEGMKEHILAVDDGERLRDFLGGYFLIANHEAPDYVIHTMFEIFKETVAKPPVIDKELYDSEGYTLHQAIIIDKFVYDGLRKDPLLFIDLFSVQDTEFIRTICQILEDLVGLLEL